MNVWINGLKTKIEHEIMKTFCWNSSLWLLFFKPFPGVKQIFRINSISQKNRLKIGLRMVALEQKPKWLMIQYSSYPIISRIAYYVA